MRIILLTLLILFFAGYAHSQVPAFVGLYTGETSGDCWIDADTGVVDVYVRFDFLNEFTQVSFRIENNTTLTRLGEECPAGATCSGDPETGITISMPCTDATAGLVLLKVTYVGSGDSPACSSLRILPVDEGTGEWLPFVDCQSSVAYADGGWLLINPDGSAGCTGCDLAIPVEDTTWGRIKQLYSTHAP